MSDDTRSAEEDAIEQRFVANMRAKNHAENEQNRLATVYLIEATYEETHYLWTNWSDEALALGLGDSRMSRVPWEHISLGFGKTIGHFGPKGDEMPVHVSVWFARIGSSDLVKGHIIAFYEATSQVVDHRMVDKWLPEAFPASRGKTNAANFHNCIFDLMRMVNKLRENPVALGHEPDGIVG